MRLHAGDFALGESDRVPAHARLANRNLMNLLEMRDPSLCNNVFHRLGAYAASNVVLLVLWIALFRSLVAR